MPLDTAPEEARVFEKRSKINCTVDQMIAFHQDPKALARLSPPPIFMRVHRDERTSLTEGEIEFTLWFGPVPVRWIARHESGPTATSFADLMVKGPLAYWRHEHIFNTTDSGTELVDRVTLSHQAGLKGLLTRLMFDGLPLRFLFFYRHLRTRSALRRR